MTIIVEDEELPNGITFKCKVNGVTYLVLHRTKRGKRKNAHEKPIKVYSDTDHTIVAETMRNYDEPQAHSDQFVPQYSY